MKVQQLVPLSFSRPHTPHQQSSSTRPAPQMAGKKAATVLVKLLSTAGTGYFYVARKNPRKLPQKLEFVK